VLTAETSEIVSTQEQEEIPAEDIPAEHSDEGQSQLMHISVQALSGASTGDTVAVTISIGGKRGLALVDTGSTNTFIDMKFALKTNCIVVNNSTKTVKVAGGGCLHSGGHIPDWDFSICAVPFNHSFNHFSEIYFIRCC
jgi:hypothetical protein